jgi:hypothetical protein
MNTGMVPILQTPSIGLLYTSLTFDSPVAGMPSNMTFKASPYEILNPGDSIKLFLPDFSFNFIKQKISDSMGRSWELIWFRKILYIF